MTEKKIKIELIVPAVVVHNLDPHTGIPFLPHMAGYLAGMIDHLGYELSVTDCFGINPYNRRVINEFMILGIDEEEVVRRISADTKICFIYCKVIEDLISVERITQCIKKKRPDLKICLFENIQTTNSFSLKKIVNYLFDKGCDLTIFGEPERRIKEIIKGVLENENLENIPDIAFKKNNQIVCTKHDEYDNLLDELPLPLWNKFDMSGYWKMNFSHAPVKKNSKFLPILSSRGCPFRCKFCVSPMLNPKWRKRSAKSVADEMEFFYKTMNVTDFHFSDLDPTVDEKRTAEICKQLISKNLPIEWKLAQGTKIETIKNIETLELMKKSGLTFFAFSPESGSKELMKKLNKPFDYDHALKITKHLNKLKIKTQACFIAGTPPEENVDRKKTIDYVKKLVKSGVDEIAVYIYSPIPGSFFADQVGGFEHYSQLTRSPTWRKDYKIINNFRIRMYLTFFTYKLLFYPNKVFSEIFRLLSRNFSTKMEMSIFKFIKLRLLYKFPTLFKSS